MLYEETAKGSYSTECIKTKTDICLEAEAAVSQTQLFNDPSSHASRLHLEHGVTQRANRNRCAAAHFVNLMCHFVVSGVPRISVRNCV
jgi:pyruvate kinase